MWNSLWQMVISALGEFCHYTLGQRNYCLIICYFSELPVRNCCSYDGLGWGFLFFLEISTSTVSI